MKTNPSQSSLDVHKFTSTIRRQPEFFAELPNQEQFNALPEDERRSGLKRAIAASALSLSAKHEKEHGTHNLDAHLYDLVAHIPSFYDNDRTLVTLRDRYGNPSRMPRMAKQQFYESKENLTAFNHSLHEVINAGAARFNFDELLTFMTNIHAASAGKKTLRGFHERAREVLVGMRNEMAFEQILIEGEYDYELGSVEQDAIGADVIIDGVPIDVKASRATADRARERAMQEGRNPDLIIWSHIDFEDYGGQLTLPYSRVQPILDKARPDINRALASYRGERLAS